MGGVYLVFQITVGSSTQQSKQAITPIMKDSDVQGCILTSGLYVIQRELLLDDHLHDVDMTMQYSEDEGSVSKL